MSGKLTRIMEELRGMSNDLAQMNFTSDKAEESRVHEFIERADIEQCKAIVDALVCRVSSLIGIADHLEDASAQLQQEIDGSN